MYKLLNDTFTNQTHMVFRLINKTYIPLNPDNTDYANFKKEILADETQLEDADGVLMTAEQAKDYVRSLP